MANGGVARTEVIMAGIGGMGVVTAGQVLLRAASRIYEYVSLLPVYGYAMRGGLCECTVILSREKIRAPLLDQAHAVLLLDSSQFASFEPRVRSGGIMITEKTGLSPQRRREDYKLYALPGMETAVSIGSTVVNNMILLGAYIVITDLLPTELLERELLEKYKGDEIVLARNVEAFKRGLELGKAVR
jgi:2-oxoglutarate ferredoxin oxidoreductase subunit gamma